LQKAVELGLGGDVPMLRFLLSRVLPRDRLITIELPQLEFADDAVEALGRIAAAVAEGAITPSEGSALATVVNAQSQAIERADLVKRVDALEAQLRARGAL
jgi:hypothetical protein